jgi:GGDEF domain-containing protein
MFDFRKIIGGRSSTPDSISGSIRNMDDLSELLEFAIACYGDALDGIGQHAPDTPRTLRDEYRRKLKQIRGLLGTPGKSALESVRKQLDAELRTYGKALEAHIHQIERDVKEIMTMMAAMADSLASREKQHNVRFRGVAKQLRLLTTADNLAEIRLKLASEVEQLEKYVDEMARDTQAALERVKGDILAREQQAASRQPSAAATLPAGGELRSTQAPPGPGAWVDSATDPVTQLAGRPEVLRTISEFKRDDRRFCLACFSVQQFEQHLSRYGRGVMDAVLKEVSFRIKEGFPGATVIGRWNDADFMVVSELPLPDLATEVNELERRLSLTFSIPGRGERIMVSCRTSAVQSLRTETAAEMIARALAKHQPVAT